MSIEKQLTILDVDFEPIKVSVKFRSKYQQWKFENDYHKADTFSDIRCKNCKHLISKLAICPSEKNYYKCEILGISGSNATDIRLSNVCKNFECYVKED